MAFSVLVFAFAFSPVWWLSSVLLFFAGASLIVEVDLSAVDLNQMLYLADLTVPEGVEIPELTHGRNSPIVSIHHARAAEEPEAVVGAEPAAGAAAAAAPAAGAAAAKPAAAKPAEAKKDAKK